MKILIYFILGLCLGGIVACISGCNTVKGVFSDTAYICQKASDNINPKVEQPSGSVAK